MNQFHKTLPGLTYLVGIFSGYVLASMIHEGDYSRGMRDEHRLEQRTERQDVAREHDNCLNYIHSEHAHAAQELDVCRVNSKALSHSVEVLEIDLERCMGIRPRHRR